MTLNDIENWVVTGVAAVIATLVGAVRHGDLKRIEAIEVKLKQQDDHVANEVRELRSEFHEISREIKTDLENKHAQIVGLLVGLQKK